MKRKALITSTALLLVALMCLATASYAWFTAGGSSSIQQFDLSVSESEANVLLAAVNTSGTVVSDYKNTLSFTDWGTDGAKFPTKLTPVSTVNAEDFFKASYSDVNNDWTSQATSDGYIYFKFSAKAIANGTANIEIVPTATDLFKNAVKVAVTVGDETTLYDLAANDPTDYARVSAAGAVSEKVTVTPEGGSSYSTFEPKNNSVGFDTQYGQNALAKTQVTFQKDVAQTITVAIWLEGMDDDCQGNNWDLKNEKIDVKISDWVKTPAAEG